MTYLQICQFVQRYLGAGNDLPSNPMTTVAGQTGYLYEIVNWVADAYRDIQQEQSGWMFRRLASPSMILTAGTDTYSKAAIQTNASGTAIPLYERIYPYKNGESQFISVTANGTTRGNCYYIPYEKWGGVMANSLPVLSNALPTSFTIQPDESIRFSPPPSTSTVATFQYTKTIAVLAADGDIPIWPSEWHDAIAWRSIRYWALVRENSTKYKLADMELQRIMQALRASQLSPPPQGPEQTQQQPGPPPPALALPITNNGTP